MNIFNYPNKYHHFGGENDDDDDEQYDDNYDDSDNGNDNGNGNRNDGFFTSIYSIFDECPQAKYYLYMSLIVVLIYILFTLVHGSFSTSTLCVVCVICVCLFTGIVYASCMGEEIIGYPAMIPWCVAIILAMIMCGCLALF